MRRTWAAARGRAWTPEDLAAVMGANSLAWARIMRERLDLDLPDQVIVDEIVAAIVERYERLGAPEIEGADAAIRRLAAVRIPLGLASSAHPAVIDAALAALGIRGLLIAVVSSDDVPHGKPAPDVYLLAASRMGVDPSDCLVVEDSLNGVLAGRAAGMTVALVPNASVPPAPGARVAASVVLESLAGLDSLLVRPAA